MPVSLLKILIEPETSWISPSISTNRASLRGAGCVIAAIAAALKVCPLSACSLGKMGS